MTVFGVTGTSRLLSEDEKGYVHRIVRRSLLGRTRLPGPATPRSASPHKLVSGAAWGVDTEAVLAVWGLIPFANIILVVPGTANHNRGLVERAAKLGSEVVTCKTLHTMSATYLARDDKVATLTEVLLAFPQKSTPYRSGTFATINRAKKAGRKVRMYPLTNA